MPRRRGVDAPVVPVRRMIALLVAGFAALLAVGLVMGSQTSGPDSQRVPYAVVIFGTQVFYVLVTTMAIRPPDQRFLTVVGLVTALAADVGAIVPDEHSLTPLVYSALGGIAAGAIGQLFSREGRMRITESIGSSVVVVIGVTAFAMLLVITRVNGGTQTIFVALVASGVALSIARLADVIAPIPRLAPQVPRGAAGIVAGTMIGTAVAGYIGKYLYGFTPSTAAIVGACAAGASVLADLTVGFAEAGRELEGDPPTMWLARHMQGPLAGFALAAPVAYLISIFYLTSG